MTKEEFEQVRLMIETFGYYQSFHPIQEWFGWDDKTTTKNIKEVLNK